jgi:hypothetical protein
MHPNLRGFWRLENTLLDASGNGNHGTVGAGSAAYAAGKFGRAWDNNATRYIQLPASNVLAPSPAVALTISLWVRPASVGGLQRWVSLWSADTGLSAFSVRSNGQKIQTLGASVTSVYLNGRLYANEDLSNNVWYHVAAVWSGVSQIVHGTPAEIGRYWFANDQYFTGQIDEVQIYNAALDANDIRRVMMCQMPQRRYA